MRGLTMLRTALQRPPAAPPTVVERFPLPPRVRRPSTLVSLIRLAWEKLTPTLTIRHGSGQTQEQVLSIELDTAPLLLFTLPILLTGIGAVLGQLAAQSDTLAVLTSGLTN